MSSEGDKLPEQGRGAEAHRVEKRPLTSVSTRQHHIAEMARRYAHSPITTLSHNLDLLWMREAFKRLRKDSATGVDGQTVADYGRELDHNLAGLLERAKSGSYRAPLVRRKHIPKNEKETRPIGIPTTENKVLERAVVMLLEPVYEVDFLDCSYGFRPQRSPHQALDAIREALRMDGAWVVDVDIRKYFDTIPHQQLMEILRQRIGDGVILRLIAKWLKAGIWEEGAITYPEDGTPQGGVVSPMLSNVYLHTVLDLWFENQVKPTLRGKAKLVRFADDFVLLMEKKEEAEYLLKLLPERFTQYGLTIHPEKTRLVDFRHPWKSKREPETFDFLGFTHYWGKTRNKGYAVNRKTARGKLTKALTKVREWCKANRHEPVKQQHGTLTQKLNGHYNYYGVRGNSRSMADFKCGVERIWHHWLSTRTRGKKGMSWKRFHVLVNGVFKLPDPRITKGKISPQMSLIY